MLISAHDGFASGSLQVAMDGGGSRVLFHECEWIQASISWMWWIQTSTSCMWVNPEIYFLNVGRSRDLFPECEWIQRSASWMWVDAEIYFLNVGESRDLLPECKWIQSSPSWIGWIQRSSSSVVDGQWVERFAKVNFHQMETSTYCVKYYIHCI